jgi:hypothetical protein
MQVTLVICSVCILYTRNARNSKCKEQTPSMVEKEWETKLKKKKKN